MVYSTAVRKINKFLKDNNLERSAPEFCYVRHNGFSFRYAKPEGEQMIKDFIASLDYDGYVKVEGHEFLAVNPETDKYDDGSEEIKYVCISMRCSGNP
jgi:hypothetical protein